VAEGDFPVSTTNEATVIVPFDLQFRQRKHAPAVVGALASAQEERYAALGEIAQRVLRGLSVFVGGFTLEAACEVVSCGSVERSDIPAAIAALWSCSFLKLADGECSRVRYFLSRATRAFAFGKLVCHGELDLVARNHARHFQCLLEYAEVEFDRREPGRWMSRYTNLFGDVRAALDWAFSPSGDASIGVDLTMAAIPLWLLSSQADELQRRIARALKSEAAMAHSGRQVRLRTAARLAGVTDI
jgi:predicted ATPase